LPLSGRTSHMLTLDRLGAPPPLLSLLGGVPQVSAAPSGPESAPRNQREQQPTGPRHVLLITDIGRDVDDTVALLALLGAAPKLALCGVVTCGGCGSERRELVRCWLHALGKRGIPVAAGEDEASSAGAAHCHVAFTAEQQAEAGRWADRDTESASELIVRMARTFKKRLVVVAIGPMGPLAAAARLPGGLPALKHIGGLLIQGQATEGVDSRLQPSADAFNLREDMAAAAAVFEALQDAVPFTLLGKHAAYRTGLRCSDFDGWSSLLAHRVQGGPRGRSTAFGDAPPHLGQIARGQMDAFRRSAPAAFYKIYRVAPTFRTDDDWHKHLPGDVLCTPYDPLLLLACIRPDLFEAVQAGPRKQHALIGNDAQSHGVPNPNATHAALCALVERGLARR